MIAALTLFLNKIWAVTLILLGESIFKFTGFGIYEAIKYYKLEMGERFTYSAGFKAGIIVGFVATVIFTLFFAFYSTEVNTDFLQNLSTTFFEDFKSFEAIVFFTVAIMGLATSLALTLTFMQWFKVSNTPKKSD